MKPLSKRVITILLIAVVASVLGVIAGISKTDSAENIPEKSEVLLPDILMPKSDTYITEKTETLVTVEGYIITPEEETQNTETLDDPDFKYSDEKYFYVYKSHSYEFDEEGNLYILIEHEKTVKPEESTEFVITIQDEAISEATAIYLECNGYTHKAW